jgi:hypothetical protein
MTVAKSATAERPALTVLSEDDPTKREARNRRFSLRHFSKQHTLKADFSSHKNA